MLVLRDIFNLQNHLNNLKSNEKTIGFVPTMGALHNGHLSLVNKSTSQNDATLVSIFINPTQFNSVDDLKTYPSDIHKDLELLSSISDKIIVFNPNPNELYSGDIRLDEFNFNGLDRYMEGKFRGNHFVGVATVVNRLFSLIKADYAYFGEKDFQQLRIIENLIEEKNFKIKLIRCETIRSEDGLALSSRNNKLNFSSKKIATNLFKALNFTKEKIDILSIDEIEQKIYNNLSNFKEIKLEYFVIADEQNLKPIRYKPTEKYRAFIAAYVSGVRLIDNIKLY
ncbi:MAG: pantoate--beta-alanine ligase [Flavobacteriaceae bacterium]|nr:pantoate--beta-alanine ligase [Flavobacteriaceae bacterium]|tara:strand:+ start:45 stop:890 length:846 start_codon:yes stop_codon:yes gene_type:complete